MPYLYRIITISAFLLAAVGCSAVDSGGNDGAGDATSFSAQLSGNWNGHLINKTVDAGSSLRESNATADFKFTSETEGTFLFKLPKVENASAEGTFVDFAGKSLHLTISKSTISTIGVSGGSTSISYNLIGSTIELYNDRVSLELIKTSGQNPNPSDPANPNTPVDPVIGRWTCKDGFNNSWSITVKSRSSFSADVLSSGASAVWLEGSLALTTSDDKGTRGPGTVTNSNVKDYIGMRLNVSMPDPGVLDVERFKSKDEADSTIEDAFQCQRS